MHNNPIGPVRSSFVHSAANFLIPKMAEYNAKVLKAAPLSQWLKSLNGTNFPQTQPNIFHEQSLPFQKNFLSEIQRSNLRNKNKPLAVILRAEYDPNQSISSADSQHMILQIAKTYRVALKTIGNSKLFGEKIREAVQEHQTPVSLLFTLAHGSASEIGLGKAEGCGTLSCFTESDLREEDFGHLFPNATIILSSCSTGQVLAQKIADFSNRTVQAPIQDIMPVFDVFTTSGNEPRLLSYNKDEEQVMYAFRQKEEPAILAPIDTQERKRFFTDCLKYMKKFGSDSAYMQYLIGCCYVWKKIESKNQDRDALYWYIKSAQQEFAPAQFAIGFFHQMGTAGIQKSDEKALEWFLIAAKKKFPKAMHSIGLFYLEGRGGLTPSIEKAKEWWLQAAKKDFAESQYMLGVLHKYGKTGSEKSETEALYWFLLAAEQGHDGAKKAVEEYKSKKEN